MELNSKYVRVTFPNGKQKDYKVYNVGAYIKKCIEDGNVAEYLGETDEKGIIKK